MLSVHEPCDVNTSFLRVFCSLMNDYGKFADSESPLELTPFELPEKIKVQE